MEEILCQGAEATLVRKEDTLHKIRYKKSYRVDQIDESLRKSRTRREAKALHKAKELGVPVPTLYESPDEYTLVMDYIDGTRLRDIAITNSKEVLDYFTQVGTHLATLHKSGLIHGDLTTSNILIAKTVFFIDFGLSFFSNRIEDMAVDIHVLEEALESTHYQYATEFFNSFLEGYKTHPEYHNIIKRLEIVHTRGRNKKS